MSREWLFISKMWGKCVGDMHEQVRREMLISKYIQGENMVVYSNTLYTVIPEKFINGFLCISKVEGQVHSIIV